MEEHALSQSVIKFSWSTLWVYVHYLYVKLTLKVLYLYLKLTLKVPCALRIFNKGEPAPSPGIEPKPKDKKQKQKKTLVEALFRKFTFATMQLLALCTCEMILSDDNSSLSVRYRAVYVFFFSNSAVIWKQLSYQGQKTFSSIKQHKKTLNEKCGR